MNFPGIWILWLLLFSAWGAKGAAEQRIPSPCASAFKKEAVCAAANERALELLRAAHLHGFTLMQDVRTGALVAFAATDPQTADVGTLVLPLSLTKLFLAASWWDHHLPEEGWDTSVPAELQSASEKTRASIHEMLVDGSDLRGRQLAVALRQSIGAAAVLKDLEKYGFAPRKDSARDDTFWHNVAEIWQARLIPSRSHTSLTNETKDSAWANALSIGESDFMVTGLQISRFLQAVGHGGVMLTPTARDEAEGAIDQGQRADADSTRIMDGTTARRLQSAMRDTVQRGTAKGIASLLAGTGWQIGGKTGTGPGPEPIGPQSDGWFAGLIFDPKDNARFTTATFIEHGGRGGGNAARISAELARFVIGSDQF